MKVSSKAVDAYSNDYSITKKEMIQFLIATVISSKLSKAQSILEVGRHLLIHKYDVNENLRLLKFGYKK